MYIEVGVWEKAKTEFNKALEINPQHFSSITNLAAVLSKTGETKEALTLYKNAITNVPKENKYIIYFNMGGILIDENKLEDAEQNLRESVKFNPGFPASHKQLGKLLMKQERYDEARQHFQKAFDIDPKDKLSKLKLKELESLAEKPLRIQHSDTYMNLPQNLDLYCKKLKEEHSSSWFSEFLQRTNEKKRTVEISKMLLAKNIL